jgi:ribosomal RNA assembly protein
MYSYELRVPKERVAVIIGKKGFTKRQLEKCTNTKIEVDSEEGRILISGEDSLDVYNSRMVVQAIGRGFNPIIARSLCNEEICFEMVNIKDFAGKSKKKMTRLKSRVIGKQGHAWKSIETLTGTSISVYGKTVCIIGKVDAVLHAREAVENLLKGAPHAPVYKWLEGKKKRAKKWN